MIEHKWHHRVRGYYPRQQPPYSMSVCYGPNCSMRDAAIHVLQWIWAQHLENTGVPCEWAWP
eukprot:6238569-Amphidinium_carterae.1